MNIKRLRWIVFLLVMAVGLAALVACRPAGASPNTASEQEMQQAEDETVAAAGSDNNAADSLVPIEVTHVQVEVGVGSPIPVTIQVAGTWPGLCAQLATVKQQQGEFWFDISLLAHPGDPDCPPDFIGLPFGLALPINVVELPTGSYTVTVNGISTTFDVPVTP